MVSWRPTLPPICVRGERWWVFFGGGGWSVSLHSLSAFVLHPQHRGELWPLSFPAGGLRISRNGFQAKVIKYSRFFLKKWKPFTSRVPESGETKHMPCFLGIKYLNVDIFSSGLQLLCLFQAWNSGTTSPLFPLWTDKYACLCVHTSPCWGEISVTGSEREHVCLGTCRDPLFPSHSWLLPLLPFFLLFLTQMQITHTLLTPLLPRTLLNSFMFKEYFSHHIH